jgi:hypothetical protein
MLFARFWMQKAPQNALFAALSFHDDCTSSFLRQTAEVLFCSAYINAESKSPPESAGFELPATFTAGSTGTM